MPPSAVFDRIYRNHLRGLSDRHGKRCRIIHRGSTNRAYIVEFEDGERVICHRQALRKI
jgi:hypothetical protein